MLKTTWGSKYSDSKRLFGQIYLYNDEGLFNGWLVTFEPDTLEMQTVDKNN